MTNISTNIGATTQLFPNTDFIAPFLGMPSPLLLGAVLMILMKAVKASPIQNWVIPYVAFILGAVGFCALNGWVWRNALVGIFIGSGTVGFHQIFRQTVDARRENDGETRFLDRKDTAETKPKEGQSGN